ncbi:uncharacterized protein LOC107649199 isoform X2 [Monodelphis domestica]|uniref:uncharacterized protein LOC107649199 isoform X2 n=1 Tax=Monodelphis domestica TaxID=13616 RepID=UPI0024E232E6|nr:uncharacterized protein LOC107649199 isoform X2 [Monodelphis domestica]XP_056681812.1 uncharacterized protein LOC107649199 isoform X2 [Monodelphis domestica]
MAPGTQRRPSQLSRTESSTCRKLSFPSHRASPSLACCREPWRRASTRPLGPSCPYSRVTFFRLPHHRRLQVQGPPGPSLTWLHSRPCPPGWASMRIPRARLTQGLCRAPTSNLKRVVPCSVTHCGPKSNPKTGGIPKSSSIPKRAAKSGAIPKNHSNHSPKSTPKSGHPPKSRPKSDTIPRSYSFPTISHSPKRAPKS